MRKAFSRASGARDKARLTAGHKKVVKMAPPKRQKYIRKNGPTKWRPIKKWLTAELGHKCWYTEVELVGASLAIDHFRPIRDYWWLAFDVVNYRVSCPFANSPKHNKTHGCAGGKGDNFPLLGAGVRATRKGNLRFEQPVILDPCNKGDCDLVAFRADGLPILNPAYEGDPIAQRRVQESKLLLNLDHPDFNTKREQLYHEIVDEVQMYEALPAASPQRARIVDRISKRLAPSSAFSTAALYYVRLHRHLNWVETLLAKG